MARPGRQRGESLLSAHVDPNVRALLDALPFPAMLLAEDERLLYANELLRSLMAAPEAKGTNPAKLPRKHQQTTPLGRLVIVAQEQEGLSVADNIQLQRLASLGFMCASICHEVSNPLAAVHSMVQILQSRQGTSAAIVEKGLDSIATNVARALKITKKLGDFSRVEGEGFQPTSIDAAIQEAVALLRHSPAGRAIAVEQTGSAGLMIPSQPGALQQVLFNLLLNAAQAMEGEGKIEVSVLVHGGRVHLGVRDHGPGVPEEKLHRIFEPFYTTKPPGEGTGLGLAITYELVQELHGTIGACNHPEGGLMVTVELPCDEGRA